MPGYHEKGHQNREPNYLLKGHTQLFWETALPTVYNWGGESQWNTGRW